MDRFDRTLTVFRKGKRGVRKLVFAADAVYTTPLLPGFELSLTRLFAECDRLADAKR